jgi:hypothetical protein
VLGEDALQFFDYGTNSFEMNSLTTALQGKKLRTSREKGRTWKEKGRTSREERPHFRGKSSALQGKKGRTSREERPHFKGKSSALQGKKRRYNPCKYKCFQYPHDIN